MKIGTKASVLFLLGMAFVPGSSLAFDPPKQETIYISYEGVSRQAAASDASTPVRYPPISKTPPATLESSLEPAFASRQQEDVKPKADARPHSGANGHEFQQALGGGQGKAMNKALGPPVRLHPKEFSPPLAEPEVVSGAVPAMIPVHVPAAAAGGESALPPVSAALAESIVGFRLGAHPGMQRVVFDLSGKAGYSYAVGKTGMTVTIGFSGADWRAGAARGQGRGMISSYSFVPDANGGAVSLNTHVPVEVRQAFALPPMEGKGYRVVIDLVDARDQN